MMGSIAEKLDYLLNTKEEIRTAMNAAGVSVSEEDSFRSYAEKLLNTLPSDGTESWTPAILGYEGHSSVIGKGWWKRNGDVVRVHGEIRTTERLNPDDSTNLLTSLIITGLPFKSNASEMMIFSLSEWHPPLDYSQKYSVVKNGSETIQYQSPPEFDATLATGLDKCIIRANAIINDGSTSSKFPLALAAIKGALPLLILDIEYPVSAE